MDISSHIGLSVTDDVNNLHGLCMNALESTQGVIKDFSVDQLSKDVTKFLNIQDDAKPKFQKKDAHQESNIITEQCPGDPISLPTQLKPVSALKGSREKRGVAPPTKLTVKWAPDVYDPVPTSVSHVVTNNKSSRHSKKNSKKKQKDHGSKSSRGSKGKEKKQARKHGGNSSKLAEHEEEAIDFHVGNPDQLCASSFLGRYETSMHLSSLAEAT